MDKELSQWCNDWNKFIDDKDFNAIPTTDDLKQNDIDSWNNTKLISEIAKPADIANFTINSPNPVHRNTLGKDQDSNDKDFANSEDLEKLAELKKKISEKESEMLSAEALKDSEKCAKLENEVKKLKLEADKLSQSLIPGYVSDNNL